MTQGRFGRRFTAWVAVLALHLLFVLMLLARGPIERGVTPNDRTSVLFLLQAPHVDVTTSPPKEPRMTGPMPTIVDEPNTLPEQTSTAPSPREPAATVDWNTHAAEAAAAIVDKAIRQETRKCDPSDSPTSFLPRCKPRTREFEWNPEPPKVGFSGGLPYVRVGERCVVALGFFACGIGKLPAANGELFEGMSDPERDRSSVPSPHPPDYRPPDYR